MEVTIIHGIARLLYQYPTMIAAIKETAEVLYSIPTVTDLSPETLTNFIHRGEIVKLKANLFGPDIDDLTLESLQASFPEVPVFTHHPEQPSAGTPMDEFIKALLHHPDCPVSDWRTPFAPNDLRSRLYGVLNLKRLKPLHDALNLELFQPWATTIPFLWLGYSLGGLHFDEFNNILYQIRGTKRILMFPRQYTDIIDGRHSPKRVPALGFLSPAALQPHPWLAAIPHAEVTLEPGEAIILPAYTYHAPLATGYDTLSLNAFLVPHYRQQELIPDSRQFLVKKANTHSAAFFYLLKLSSWWYARTHQALIKIGPYEFV